jgi:hypothetical protein
MLWGTSKPVQSIVEGQLLDAGIMEDFFSEIEA